MAAVITLVVSSLSGQKTNQGSTYKKCFIGSTLFLLGNFLPNEVNPPSFVQLNFGYRLNPKNIISIKAKIWKYAWSLGIPYGKSFEAPEEKFPGYSREYGLAIVYQRFLWKGLYTADHVMNAKQTFVDNNGKKIKNGYQMFNTYRLGYHVPFLKNAFLLNPLSQLPIDLYNLKCLRPLQYSMINGLTIFCLNQDSTWDINFDILL